MCVPWIWQVAQLGATATAGACNHGVSQHRCHRLEDIIVSKTLEDIRMTGIRQTASDEVSNCSVYFGLVSLYPTNYIYTCILHVYITYTHHISPYITIHRIIYYTLHMCVFIYIAFTLHSIHYIHLIHCIHYMHAYMHTLHTLHTFDTCIHASIFCMYIHRNVNVHSTYL